MAKNLLQHLSGGILLLILFAMMVPAAELAAEPTTGCSSAACSYFSPRISGGAYLKSFWQTSVRQPYLWQSCRPIS